MKASEQIARNTKNDKALQEEIPKSAREHFNMDPRTYRQKNRCNGCLGAASNNCKMCRGKRQKVK